MQVLKKFSSLFTVILIMTFATQVRSNPPSGNFDQGLEGIEDAEERANEGLDRGEKGISNVPEERRHHAQKGLNRGRGKMKKGLNKGSQGLSGAQGKSGRRRGH